MLVSLRSQERREYMQEKNCNGHGFKFRVYLYLSIHAWDV